MNLIKSIQIVVVYLSSRDFRKKMVIFLDAFPFEYLDKKTCPNISSVGKGRKLGTLLGYSASIHPSIWTGVLPDIHGSWTEYQLGKIKAKPIFNSLLSFAPKRFRAVAKYPFSLLGFKMSSLPAEISFMFKRTGFDAKNPPLSIGDVKTVFGLVKGRSMNYNYYVDSIAQPFENDSSLDVFYFTSLDHTGHLFGLGNRFENEIKLLDEKIGILIKKYEKFDADTIIFSDHGMTPIKNRINIEMMFSDVGLKNGKDFVVVYNSTMLQIWDSGHGLEKAENVLGKISAGHILGKKELIEFGLNFKDNRYGDLLFLMDPGWEIFPNFYHNILMNRVKAMHGYLPGEAYSDGILVSNKEMKKKKNRVIDIYNSIVGD